MDNSKSFVRRSEIKALLLLLAGATVFQIYMYGLGQRFPAFLIGQIFGRILISVLAAIFVGAFVGRGIKHKVRIFIAFAVFLLSIAGQTSSSWLRP